MMNRENIILSEGINSDSQTYARRTKNLSICQIVAMPHPQNT